MHRGTGSIQFLSTLRFTWVSAVSSFFRLAFRIGLGWLSREGVSGRHGGYRLGAYWAAGLIMTFFLYTAVLLPLFGVTFRRRGLKGLILRASRNVFIHYSSSLAVPGDWPAAIRVLFWSTRQLMEVCPPGWNRTEVAVV